ncbi:hypothetical protein RF11_15145 [Thelohanellus kitauei]|uniref:Uncharacterized protein n=1 Tax=Thelohanellus kitauei TaxID=669202 RepID=A0A0C2N100_THEKT|nr:hypothetical protein RF11_15145 [Thelohanellus kitauei]
MDALEIMDIKLRSGAFISIAFMSIPLVLDIFVGSKLFTCPADHYKYYSLLMMFAPSIGVILLTIAISIRNDFNHNQIYFFKRAIIRFFKRIVLTFTLIIFGVSLSFIYSEYFTCFMIGPGDKNGMN